MAANVNIELMRDKVAKHLQRAETMLEAKSAFSAGSAAQLEIDKEIRAEIDKAIMTLQRLKAAVTALIE